MKLGNLVEVEIVGDDLAVVDLGELDQLHVDLADLGKILLDNRDVEVRHLQSQDAERALTDASTIDDFEAAIFAKWRISEQLSAILHH